MNRFDETVIPAGLTLFCGIMGVFVSLVSLFTNSVTLGIASNKTGSFFYLILSLLFFVGSYGYLKGKNWASNLCNFTMGIYFSIAGVYQLTSRSTNIDSIVGIVQLVGGITLLGVVIYVLRRPQAE